MSANNFKKAMDNYVQVKDRIKEFREVFKHDYAMTTELLDAGANYDTVLFKASIIDIGSGSIVATGHSFERKSDNPNVNITSIVENCETSAWGRALANFGMKIEKGIASKEEMKRTQHKADPYTGTVKEKQTLISLLRSQGVTCKDRAKDIHEKLLESKVLNDSASLIMFINKYNEELDNGNAERITDGSDRTNDTKDNT